MVEAITQLCRKFGSFPNGKKFLFFVKLYFEDKACDIFGTQTSASQPLVDVNSENYWDPPKLPANKSQLLD